MSTKKEPAAASKEAVPAPSKKETAGVAGGVEATESKSTPASDSKKGS